MPTILTLIGKPGALTQGHARRVREALAESGIITRTETDWLSEGEACDFLLPEVALGAIHTLASNALAGEEIDAIVQHTEERRKRLLIADMDSTIITCECLDEIADFAGLKPKIAKITERAMRGEIAFEPALRERVALLKGLPEGTLQTVMQTRVHLVPGARTLVQTMRRNGARCVLVSGGFTYFTERVAALAGFDAHRANFLEIAGGKLTGTVIEPILGREAKLAALHSEAQTAGLRLDQTLAVGDGANDLAMIQAAGLGVAYHAKPIVAQGAPAVVAHNDLTALLFIQGYHRREFVNS